VPFLEKKVQTKDEVLAETDGEHIALDKSLGEHWSEKTDIGLGRFPPWLGIGQPSSTTGASYGHGHLTFMAHFRSIRIASTDQEFARRNPTRVEAAHPSRWPALG
jgi:hypothetical protein